MWQPCIIYIYIYTYIYICVCVFCVCAYITYAYACTYIYIHTHAVCIYTHFRTCVYTIYIYIYVCMLAVAASKGNLRAAFLKLRRSTKHNLVVDSSEGGQLCFFLVMVRHIPEQKRLESTHFQHRDASKPAMSYQLGIAMPPLRVTGCTGAVGSTKRVFGRLFLIQCRVFWSSGLGLRCGSGLRAFNAHPPTPCR